MQIAAFMLFALAVAAQSRPDFSGLWQLNLDRSTFRGQAPKHLLVKIHHRDPSLVQTMLVVAADGSEQQQTFTYDTSGSESALATGGGEGTIRTYWSGTELVFDSELTTPHRVFRFSDRWSLSPDGQTLRMAHPNDDLAGQVAVFEKAPPEAAAGLKAQ